MSNVETVITVCQDLRKQESEENQKVLINAVQRGMIPLVAKGEINADRDLICSIVLDFKERNINYVSASSEACMIMVKEALDNRHGQMYLL
ncbi:hypothetical protein IGK74_002419 [Enterococcus sp. AZ150]|uniref:hypothetical protein n=1 Tax=Enterococcus sp. AZ150 TaxID=2774866 RepID=UPI003F2389B1